MRLLLLGAYLVCGSYSIECMRSGADDTGDTLVLEDCADDLIVVCSQPMYIEYTGLSAGDHVCGTCKTDTINVTCSECDTDGCNTAYEVGETFKCYNYTLNTTSEAWVMEEDLSTCHRLKDTGVKCNMPGTAADADYSFPHNGCGPCATDATTDTCVECDTDKCNEESSATTFTATFLPLIAVIYSLVM